MPLASFPHPASIPQPRRRAFAVAALVLMALVVAQLVRPSLTRAATTQAFVAKADSFVDAGRPRQNFGQAASIRTARGQRDYLRFDTPGLQRQNVKRATLRLFSNEANRFGVAVYSLADNGWLETSLTWDGAPSPGGFVGHSRPTLVGSWTEIDVTAALRRNGAMGTSGQLSLVVRHSPFANRRLHIVHSPHEAETSFASRETGATAPQLVVTTEPAPPPTTLPGPSTTLPSPSTTAKNHIPRPPSPHPG